MRVPSTPPDPYDVIRRTVAADHERSREMLLLGETYTDDPYRHWDTVRRRPPPEGFTAEEFWAALKLKRLQSATQLDLQDTRGRPFWFTEPPSVRQALHRLDRDAAGVIGSRVRAFTHDDSRRYVARSLIEEPFSSSILEGAATTRDIARKLVEESRTPRTRDERMVLNNYRAMEFVKGQLDGPLTPQLLLQVHKVVSEGTLDRPDRAGELRHVEDDVRVVDDGDGEILHTPPSASLLPGRLEALCDFANAPDTDRPFVHPLIRAIILHFMIGYEHPFVDGNGRTARAIFYWSVLKAGYWMLEYVSISRTIMEAPAQYYRAFLETETDGGDLTYFIDYHLGVLGRSIDALHACIERRQAELESFSDAISSADFNHRQTFVLNDAALKRASRFTIAEHQGAHGVSYLTARNDLEDLVRRGFLTKTKQGRVSVYRPVARMLEQFVRDRASRA